MWYLIVSVPDHCLSFYFDSLKKALTNPLVLGLPKSQDPFILDTDASDVAIGAELIQVQNW